MNFKKALIISLSLHILPFIILFLFLKPGVGGSGTKDKRLSNKNSNAKNKKIIPKEANTPTEITIITKKGPGIKKPKVVKNKCKDWYGGIGVVLSFSYDPRGAIVEVAKVGYPAAEAGIEAGDIIRPAIDGEDLLGDPGTQVAILVTRGEEVYILRVTRGKICVGAI